MEDITVSFTQTTRADKEIASIEIILKVMDFYYLNKIERARVLEYLQNRNLKAQASVATEADSSTTSDKQNKH